MPHDFKVSMVSPWFQVAKLIGSHSNHRHPIKAHVCSTWVVDQNIPREVISPTRMSLCLLFKVCSTIVFNTRKGYVALATHGRVALILRRIVFNSNNII